MSPDTPCPSERILRRSLDPDDPMAAAERRRVETHVEQCDQGCKRVIDDLLRDKTRPVVTATAAGAAQVAPLPPPGPANRPGPPVETAADLTECLRHYRLLEPAQLAELGRLQAALPAPRALAAELIRRGWLSPYQANRLLAGRGQELLLGSYVLLERLGEGGMGEVFKARNWKLGQTVALKLIGKERVQDPEAVRRFQRETRAAALLHHPNLVRAFDADEVRGTHLLVMEYVPGSDLAKLVKRHGPLPVEKACDYARQAALGLQYASERGLVHRDVKPHNLLATPQGVVKVLDMGLARLDRATGEASASTVTPDGAVMGTPDYMAPEQSLDSHTVDVRADLYALGCTLYFLLAGRAPFPGGTLGEKIARHQVREPAPVEEVCPGTPPAVAMVVRKLMAKRPEDRYQTPAEAAAALEAATSAPCPSTARAPSPPTAPAPRDVGGAPADTATAADTVPAPHWRRERPRRRAETRRRITFYTLGGLVSLGLIGLFVAALRFIASAPRPAVPPAAGAGPEVQVAAFDRWLEATAALPAGKQVEAVAAKMKERNPGFDGVMRPTVENGVTTGLEFLSDDVTDVAPVQALTGLRKINCAGTARGKGRLSDLAPLRRLKLTFLRCDSSPISDLTALKGMDLTYLSCNATQVTDLRPLKGMKLIYLNCDDTPVVDLRPLTDMPLVYFGCRATQVTDLSPLKGMPLTYLAIEGAPASDLSPLRAMPLTSLYCANTKVSDLSPLQGMPLKDLSCDFDPKRDAEILRRIKTLETINGQPAAVVLMAAAAPPGP